MSSLSDGFRKAFLSMSSIIMVIVVSYLEPSFRDPYFVLQYLQSISLLLILSIGLGLVVLSGCFDLGLAGLYLLSIGTLQWWRKQGFLDATNFQQEMLLAGTIFIGSAFVYAILGYFSSIRKQLSALLSLGFGGILGGFGLYLMPVEGVWSDPWFVTNILVSPLIIFSISVILSLIVSLQTIRYFFPDLNWVKPVAVLWLASFLINFIVYEYGGLPISSILAVGVVALAYFLIHQSIYGRAIYAVGDNEDAARLCGVSITRTKILVFAILGGLVALSSFFETRLVSPELPFVPFERHFDAILAVVLGGFSFRGGVGNLSGLLVAVLFVTSLSLFWQFGLISFSVLLVLKSSVLLMALVFDPGTQKS